MIPTTLLHFFLYNNNTNFSFEDIDADSDSSEEDVDVNVLNKSLDTTSIGSDESGSSWGVQKKKSPTGRAGMKSPKSSGMTASVTKKDIVTGSKPALYDDVELEILSFIKECRYTDATELLLKTKSEVTEILNQVCLYCFRSIFLLIFT